MARWWYLSCKSIREVIVLHGYIPRAAEAALARAFDRSPAVAILGPRQCGKSTLAREFLRGKAAVLLDLQDRVDRSKLTEPELFFERHRTELVCLDEIQLLPEFFASLRSEIDRDRRPGRFLILGSASRDLLRQSSESLAGRLAYLDLTPFLFAEVDQMAAWQSLWLRGGFPESLLARSEMDSLDWRQDFVQTFLERDIPGLGMAIPVPAVERLWRLLAHCHGQTANYSKFAAAMDLSVPTLKKYLAVLEQTYMVRLLPPSNTNLKKRLTRSPKVYVRDSGILHALLEIEDCDRLLGHPVAGASWEAASSRILSPPCRATGRGSFAPATGRRSIWSWREGRGRQFSSASSPKRPSRRGASSSWLTACSRTPPGSLRPSMSPTTTGEASGWQIWPPCPSWVGCEPAPPREPAGRGRPCRDPGTAGPNSRLGPYPYSPHLCAVSYMATTFSVGELSCS